MYVTAEHLRDQVIGPTLKYLGAWTPATESLLLEAAVDAPDLGLFSAATKALACSISRLPNTVISGTATWRSIRRLPAACAAWPVSGHF